MEVEASDGLVAFSPNYMRLGLNADLDFFEDVYMETLAEKLGMEVS